MAVRQHARGGRCLAAPVDDHAQRLPRRRDVADGELRIVGEHRPGAGHHRAGTGAEAMAVLARRLAGDPLALSTRERGAPIETRGDLHPDPRAPARHPRDVAGVELARLGFHEPELDGDARLAQPARAVPRQRIRILHCRHDARDACGDQRIGARRRAARVVARLERHVGRGAPRIAPARLRVDQRVHLGMRESGARVEPFADQRPVLGEHAADAGIGRGGVEAERRLGERPRHVRAVGVGKGGHGNERRLVQHRRVNRDQRFLIFRTASRKSSTSWKLRYTDAKRMYATLSSL